MMTVQGMYLLSQRILPAAQQQALPTRIPLPSGSQHRSQQEGHDVCLLNKQVIQDGTQSVWNWITKVDIKKHSRRKPQTSLLLKKVQSMCDRLNLRALSHGWKAVGTEHSATIPRCQADKSPKKKGPKPSIPNKFFAVVATYAAVRQVGDG